MSITHAKVVTVPDDGTSPVGTDEWNAAHVVDMAELPTADQKAALDAAPTLSALNPVASVQSVVMTDSMPTGENYVVKMRLLGDPDGGTFTLIFRGQETAPIAWNAAGYDVYIALTDLSNIGPDDLSWSPNVSNLPDPIRFLFIGSLGLEVIEYSDLTVGDNSLTGGTTPSVDLHPWWEGRPPSPLVPVAQIAIGVNTSLPSIFANIGTVDSPIWRTLSAFGYQANPDDDGPSSLGPQGYVETDAGGVKIIAYDFVGGAWARVKVLGNPDISVDPGIRLEILDINEDIVHGLVLQTDGLTFDGKIIGTQAAFVANGSTVDQLRDALIAVGLMAAS